jgi:hypothetical protein
MAEEPAPALTPEQENHFLEHGWVKVSNCFTREQAADVQSTMWERLGMDPDDMSTWYDQTHPFLSIQHLTLSNVSLAISTNPQEKAHRAHQHALSTYLPSLNRRT